MTETPLSFCFRTLSAGYGGHEVVKGVSASIDSGQVTALIGPNGSGKSTLLKTLGGFLPYRGRLALGGREIRRCSRRELGRLLGVVAQQTVMKAAFSVYDVIGFGRLPYQPLLARRPPADDRIIQAAAERLEIEPLLFRPVTELSGGERQRVLLAMVLAQNPPVFLLDEPTSAMDPRQAQHAFQLMRELAAGGKTVVVIAHDINAALSCADRYLALRGGELIAGGRADRIDESVLEALYDTPFVPYISAEGDKAWHPSSKKR